MNANERGTEMRKYGIQYETQQYPVRYHRTIKAAIRDMRSCKAAARRGEDCQNIFICPEQDGMRSPLTMDERAAIFGMDA